MRLQLEKYGFKVETGKKQNDNIQIPVLSAKFVAPLNAILIIG